MTDDPWAQFRKGAPPAAPQAPGPQPGAQAQPADPWAQFKAGAAPAAAQAAPAPVSAAPAPGVDPGTEAIWNKPSDVSWKDYALAHLAKPFEGFGQGAIDYPTAFADAATGGMAPRAMSWAGYDPAGVNDFIAGAHQRLGPMDYVASGAGYALGPGKVFGPAARLAGRGAAALTAGAPSLASAIATVAPKAAQYVPSAASLVAGGTEGALSAGAGTYGHMGSAEDVGNAMTLGGAIGILGGALGGGPKPSQTTAALEDAKSAAYFPSHSIKFSPREIDQSYTSGSATLSKDQTAGLSSEFKSTMDAHLKENAGSPTSASEIDGFMRGLDEAANTNADRALAGRIKENLQGVLKTSAPTTGQAVGEAADVLAKAKVAHQRFANSALFDEMNRQAALPRSGGIGQVAPTMANAELKANPKFYQGQDAAAMRGIAGAGNWLPSSWLLHHGLMYPMMGAAAAGIGAGHGYATGGENPWAKAAEEAALFGGIVGGGAGAERMIGNVLTRRAMARAAPTLTQGAPYGLTLPSGIRNMLFGQGATGAGY